MKIFRYQPPSKFQPARQNFVWPPQNKQAGGDRGVEQDFDKWLLERPNLLVDDVELADWMYIPIYWNRYYINTPDSSGNWGGGVEALADEIFECNKIDIPKFTISEADIKVLKPSIPWEDMVVFCGSRRDKNDCIDIPLLSEPHQFPSDSIIKLWSASFMGNLKTDGVRIDMHEALKDRRDCKVEHANVPEDVFVRVMLASYIGLAPRGQGAQSFRMYEAMQLGVVPLYISDIDCRPFKDWIDWDICSLYLTNVDNIGDYLDEVCSYKDMLLRMGEQTKKIYDKQLQYGMWCKYVIRTLEGL